jgi:hypothetical protein
MCLGQNPLPEEIFSAKRVLLTGATPDLLDKVAWEINSWGRFEVVATRREADIVFDFGLQWQPGQGFAIETLAITDARTGESLYLGDRMGHFASWSHLTGSLLQDFRDRIEFEHAIRLGTQAAKFFTDLSAMDERMAPTSSAPTAKNLENGAIAWKALADDLIKTASLTTKFYADSTKHDPRHNESKKWRHNSEEADKWRNDTLIRTCPTLEKQENINQQMDALRPTLTPDVVQVLNALETDAAVLNADCKSEHAANLLKGAGGKPASERQ